MSVRYHRKVKSNKNGHLNVSKSGVSYSQKAGRFTFNSKGTVSYNSKLTGLSLRMKMLVFILLFIPVYFFAKLCLVWPWVLVYKLLKFILYNAPKFIYSKINRKDV